MVLHDGEVMENCTLNRDKVVAKPFRPDCVLDEEAMKADIDKFDYYLAQYTEVLHVSVLYYAFLPIVI